MKGIKIKRIVLSFPVIIISCISCISCLTIINEHIIISKINRDPSVLDISLFNNNDLFGADYYIHIYFKDGNSIGINHVEEFGKGKRMIIQNVNGYVVFITNKSTGMGIAQDQELKLFSTLIGVQLETIIDIVKNYRAICSEIENWINLSDYKQDNEKTANGARRRALAEDIFPFPDSIIIFDGQEYFVYKWPVV